MLLLEKEASMKRGTFIVIEGGEGAGKTSQIELLKRDLPEDTLFIHEPGGTVLGEQIKKILLNGRTKRLTPEAELLLFCASRAELMREVVAPALESGRIVVADRFNLSTIAYQIHGRQKPEYFDVLRAINTFAVGIHTPSLYILLDILPEVGLERIRQRRRHTREHLSRFDKEALAFHNRVREGYLAYIKSIPSVVIDASRSVRDVHKEVLQAIDKVLTAEKPR